VKSPVRKVVFPAAGLGTRFLPATKAQPKEMLPLVDKPIIQYGVEEAVQSGIENIIIVTGRARTPSKITSTSTSSSKASCSSAASSTCSRRFARSPT
jgi:UTP-glucose-1-phosphate uridylyltransferase